VPENCNQGIGLNGSVKKRIVALFIVTWLTLGLQLGLKAKDRFVGPKPELVNGDSLDLEEQCAYG